MATDGRPVKVLRVIARLNMGGPALHVAYLAEGLRARGYDTTLVAGALARGAGAMAFVAGGVRVRGGRAAQLSRGGSPPRGPPGVPPVPPPGLPPRRRRPP